MGTPAVTEPTSLIVRNNGAGPASRAYSDRRPATLSENAVSPLEFSG
jgi:hypothetical protein